MFVKLAGPVSLLSQSAWSWQEGGHASGLQCKWACVRSYVEISYGYLSLCVCLMVVPVAALCTVVGLCNCVLLFVLVFVFLFWFVRARVCACVLHEIILRECSSSSVLVSSCAYTSVFMYIYIYICMYPYTYTPQHGRMCALHRCCRIPAAKEPELGQAGPAGATQYPADFNLQTLRAADLVACAISKRYTCAAHQMY